MMADEGGTPHHVGGPQARIAAQGEEEARGYAVRMAQSKARTAHAEQARLQQVHAATGARHPAQGGSAVHS